MVGGASLGHSTDQFMRCGAGVELTTQLHVSIWAYAHAGDRPKLTLHQVARPKVESEVTPNEISKGTPRLHHWTQTLATRKISIYVVQPWSICIGMGPLSY